MPIGDGRRRGLTVRVLALLSLALLPLGAISFWQTQRISTQAEAQSELALLLLTERAANSLQANVQRGFGAARGLGISVLELIDDPEACSAALAEFKELYPKYSFVAFIGVDGFMTCSSTGESGDFSQYPSFRASVADPKPNVVVNDAPPVSSTAVVIVTEPVRGPDGGLRGFLSLSVPKDDLLPSAGTISAESPLNMITFNDRGELLTSTAPAEEIGRLLPADLPLTEIAGARADVFAAPSVSGERRVYGLVPLLPGVAYALSTWPSSAVAATGADRLIVNGLLPLLMWAASLLVAFLALDRLVIRHIRVLSRQMRTFARTRRLVGQPLLGATGRELVEIETDFREMAESILEDEARLEDNLREKNILLKEVHHRVKNNLQLVTSIMNMQIRKAAIPETRAVLRRLQDRVMGLAAVHRALYKAKDFNSIDVSTLVSELAEQLLVSDAAAAPIRAQVEVEPLYLFPDQAVPLSLLASESMTNAVKYAGPNEAGVTRIDVSLKPVEDGRAQFSIVSSRGEPMGRVGDEGTSIEGGLGLQLMRAFEGQLGGRLTITEDEEAYRLDITFPVQTFSPDALDY